MTTKNKFQNVSLSVILVMSFLAVSVVQLLHESVHALATLLVGARLEQINLWAVDTAWPDGRQYWAEIVVAGSAAVVNIFTWGLCAIWLARKPGNASQRLFALYLGAYSMFLGFGYLLIDPLAANAESQGDWARVVMLLGGSWSIRLIVFAIGCAGTIYGYYWVGSVALDFRVTADTVEREQSCRLGFRLCVIPYAVHSLIYSVLAYWHPLGLSGTVAVLMQYWLGYSGFIWAYLIKFHWAEGEQPSANPSPLPDKISPVTGALAMVQIVITILLLNRIPLGWSL